MPYLSWRIHRLKAMNIPEILWRMSQKLRERREEKTYLAPRPVTDEIFNSTLNSLVFDHHLLSINYENQHFSLGNAITLLGGYDYETNKRNWHGGFQTENSWERTFAYRLNYKQRDDIGDARTNWELNRHHQFPLLAKNYLATGDEAHLIELADLFIDWNKECPFLHGIMWTSPMETAIRLINWSYTYGFLALADTAEKEGNNTDGENETDKDSSNVKNNLHTMIYSLRESLRIGIINMTDYLTNHYSRYSSANNHLIVEAAAIAHSGIIFAYQPWVSLGMKLLDRELPRQNYPDGINKEMSLHYQGFSMEAMALIVRLMFNKGMEIPPCWISLFAKMCEYFADCRGYGGAVVEFGDNDEGKILDFCSGSSDYYTYILAMYSFLLPTAYVDIKSTDISENIYWLFSQEDFAASKDKPCYEAKSACRPDGGVTVLHGQDSRILIGIDHGELGFGKIAAHGHADALSFQMFIDDKPILIDPGTYIYHIDIASRNEFRRTKNHNTVTISGSDQSVMQGAFLWGKRANCQLISHQIDANGKARIVAEHDGYAQERHRRKFDFDGNSELCVIDEFLTDREKEINFILAPDVELHIHSEEAKTALKYKMKLTLGSDKIMMLVESDTPLCLKPKTVYYSPRYGEKCETKALSIKTKARRVATVITRGSS
ncbi:MAG: heparinase II/III family protein [Lachnospiraceae bacterium]|jgi:hypothetical protein|nr:heparinase II/III family protein [Lachnospiraceae bacterium]